MYISRILYPVEVLGPGRRIGIWMDGCIHHCPGCSNPELWEQQACYHTDADTVLRLVRMVAAEHEVDGFTITGGDPFFQPDALRELLPRLREIAPDILVYTGYLMEELPEDILSQITVLIDGKYVEARNHGEMLRGSDNQRILILEEAYRDLYESYQREFHGRIQNFSTRDGIISVGIHLPGYERQLKQSAILKGLEEQSNG